MRAPRFALGEEVPRAWLDGDLAATHVVDALSLIFPEGERFFIRSVKHYLDRIDDPGLLEDVRGFFGQEGRHGHEHDRFNRMLEQHGYDVHAFLTWYRALAYETIEPRVPPHLRLATTVALEHMTTTLAEVAFTSEALDDAHPAVREMLLWHAVEEIEHRAVAWDVLQEVDPRMRTRVLGLVIGAAMLGTFWSRGIAALVEDARHLERVPRRRSPSFARAVRKAVPRIARSVAHYLDRGFDPRRRAIDHLARAHVERAGL